MTNKTSNKLVEQFMTTLQTFKREKSPQENIQQCSKLKPLVKVATQHLALLATLLELNNSLKTELFVITLSTLIVDSSYLYSFPTDGSKTTVLVVPWCGPSTWMTSRVTSAVVTSSTH